MKWLSKKNRNDEISYWQTIADILSALFLIILLISLLLILYILRYPEDTERYPDPGSYAYIGADDELGDDYYHSAGGAGGNGYRYVSYGGEGGGGEGGEGNGKTGQGDYEYEEPGWGDFEGTDKAAVYVRVLDAETGKIIREDGIDFTLYYLNGKQELLTVYYPEKITYKEYATTEQGTFYFPDKLRLGGHRLKELTEPYGYDATEDIEFEIEESHEWEEPYILDVPLFPSRNVIRILQTDAKTGAPLSGGLYRITAAEDIITADGTLRYHAGDNVGEIGCDEEGLAVSEELYLGEYLITQILPPDCYAVSPEPVPATVEKKQEGKLPAPHIFACEQTVFSLILTDELYPAEKISDALFLLSKDGGVQRQAVITDANGTIRLTGLAPNTAYSLTQESTPSFYIKPEKEITFTVDERGLIDGSPEKNVTLTNRIYRVNVLIRDAILRSPISDKAVTLFNANGDSVTQWTSSGNPHELNGLTPGAYRLVISGTAREMTFAVTDTAKVQEIELSIMTNGGIAGLCCAGLAILAGAAFAAFRAIKKRRKQQS